MPFRARKSKIRSDEGVQETATAAGRFSPSTSTHPEHHVADPFAYFYAPRLDASKGIHGERRTQV